MAKELIDLGTPGQPTTGDTLPEGGEKLNNHINAVYDAFSRKGQSPESQILQPTGVYQIIGFSDLTLDEEYGPGHYYEAEPGAMLFIDVNEETIVYIDLPPGYPADQVKVIASETWTPVFVRAIGSQINGQESIQLTKGVQYQYIRNISTVDGEWSQRIIDGSGNSEVTWEKHTTGERGASLCVKIPRASATAGRLSLLDSSVIPGEGYSDLCGTAADISFITAGNTTKTTVVETNVTATTRLDVIPEVQYALTAYADDDDTIICVTPIKSSNIDHDFLVKQKSLDILGDVFNDYEKNGATSAIFYVVDETGTIYLAGDTLPIAAPYPAIDVASCPITGDLFALLFNGTRHCIYRKPYSTDPTQSTDTSWELVYEIDVVATTSGGGIIVGHNGIVFSYINCDDGYMRFQTYYPEHITLGDGIIETLYAESDAIGNDICLTQNNTPFILFTRSGDQPASYWILPSEGGAGVFPDTYFATCCTLHKDKLYIGCAGRDGGSQVLVGTTETNIWDPVGTFDVIGVVYDSVDIAVTSDSIIYLAGSWDIPPENTSIHAFAMFDLNNPTADWVVTNVYEPTAVINSIQPAGGPYGFGKDIPFVGFSASHLPNNSGVFSLYGNAVIKTTRAYIINSLYVAP